jgi:hypothetical protein
MLSPKKVEEILPIFNNVKPDFSLPDEATILRAITPDIFPKRTIPYPAVLAAVAIPTIEAWLRNKHEHYAPPGRLAPIKRIWTFDKLAPPIFQLKQGRASHGAMEQVYHHEFGWLKHDTLTEKIDALAQDLTFNTDHALGLISRFRIVKAVLKSVLASGAIHSLASIACGAGEAVSAALGFAPHPVITAFFDNNREALALAQTRTAAFPDAYFFDLNVIRYQRFFNALPFEALEFTGLIDYLPEELLVAFLRSLQQSKLKLIVTGNILRKSGKAAQLERAFVYHALQWPMYYRTEEELQRIFFRAGFSGLRFIREPYGTFVIILWIKHP